MYQCNQSQKFHCAECPIRKRGAAKPKSLFARIHRWHSAWWPGWKAFQTSLRTRNARLSPSV